MVALETDKEFKDDDGHACTYQSDEMHIDSDTNDRYSSETAKSTEDCPMANGIPVRLRFKKGKHSVPMEKIEGDLFPILRRRTKVFSRNHGKPLRTTLMEATIDTGDAPPQWSLNVDLTQSKGRWW